MAFPISPTNGQQATVNGVLYTYTAATRSWARTTTSLSFGNISASIISAATIGNTGANIVGTVTTASQSSITALPGLTSFGTTGVLSTAQGSFTVSGNVVISSTAATISSTTGALQVAGGAAFAGNTYVGQNLYIGPNSFNTTLTTPTIFAVDNGGTYAQGAILNATNTGSADWIAYGNNYAGASNDHGWMDLGFTGDAFNDPNYSITKSNDGYLFASAANATVGGNLVLSTDFTGSYNDIVVGVGSFYANSEVARFHGNVSNNGNLTLKYVTPSTSTATGALVVSGGAGIAGNVFAGNVLATGFFFANGTAFVSGSGGGSGITYTASNTAPVSPRVGDQWYYTTLDTLYEYISDSISSYWVDITGANQPWLLSSNSATLSGNVTVGNLYVTSNATSGTTTRVESNIPHPFMLMGAV
jgi:lipopolysaccharide export system protein LptA